MSNALALKLTEKGLLPDTIVRQGIRRLLKKRLKEINQFAVPELATYIKAFSNKMRHSPVAVLTDKANEQHYEVPAAFFNRVLGAYNKYSCGYWPADTDDLDDAEKSALELTCQRAKLNNGQQVLELGCGWGSLTLFMAERYPDSEITAVSNSASQAAFIRQQADNRGLKNLTIITADVSVFDIDEKFDRIVSVEMFEHMRNHERLYARINHWLKADGLFFKHIFVHHSIPYLFEDKHDSDWMARFFFSGGMMPSYDLPKVFDRDLQLIDQNKINGRHYEKTANAWLRNMDNAKADLWPLFEEVYGKDFAGVWWQRWRVFFMACAELFGFDHGREWFVGHYLFKKVSAGA